MSPGGLSIIDPVSAVMALLPSKAASAGDSKAILRLLAEDLGDLPYFAVAAACFDFRRGAAGDGHWAPTGAEIRQRAAEHIRPVAAELAGLKEVLEFAADPVPPEESRRGDLMARFAELQKELHQNVDPLAAKKQRMPADITRTEAQVALDRMAAEGPWAPKLSARALATIREATNPIETEEDLKECLR